MKEKKGLSYYVAIIILAIIILFTFRYMMCSDSAAEMRRNLDRARAAEIQRCVNDCVRQGNDKEVCVTSCRLNYENHGKRI